MVNFISITKIVEDLIKYIKEQGFTHIELMRFMNILLMIHGVIKALDFLQQLQDMVFLKTLCI